MLILAIVTASVAWFVSNDTASVTETILTAASSVNITVSVVPTTDYEPYMGQTGLDKGADSVYTVDFVIGIQYDVQGFTDMGAKAQFNSIEILKVDPDNEGEYIYVEAPIADCTWRLYDYTVVEGQYVKLGGFMPNEDNFVVSDDGLNNYYEITGTGTMTFLFTLVFQSEQNYRNWLIDVFDYEAFPYSTPDYMDAIFTFSVNFSTDNYAV